MAFSSLCATQNVPGILRRQGNVHLDIAIRHAPKIQDTILWNVLYIFRISIQMEKTGSCKHPNSRRGAVMFGFHFVGFGINNKIVYKHRSFSII
jgi:hypothetical protein